jgi:hypothetical protein
MYMYFYVVFSGLFPLLSFKSVSQELLADTAYFPLVIWSSNGEIEYMSLTSGSSKQNSSEGDLQDVNKILIGNCLESSSDDLEKAFYYFPLWSE